MPSISRVCVFCGSSPGLGSTYLDAARRLGTALAERGLGLVYGGASIGLMGAVADAALAAGGHVTGVIPTALVNKELAHPGLSDLRVVASMHQRKATMADLADAFVAMPGGLGTLEETFEILTWAQLGLHRKPCGFLDVAGYYQPLLAFIEHGIAQRFVRAEHRRVFLVEADPDTLLDGFATFSPPDVEKWIDRGET